MCSQIDECSAYISKFKALCFEQLSPNVRSIQKDFVTIDAHVKRLESVCREKSILNNKLQCEIESLSIGQEECERYQVELGSMKTRNVQLNDKLELSDKTVEIFETQLQDARKEIQHLETTVENNIQDTAKMQNELENLTASVSLTINENSFKKLEIENLNNQLVQATGLHERNSNRIRETEDELAYIKSQVEQHSVIGVDGNEAKIEYKTRIDSEILTCISRKNSIENEIQVATRKIKVQKDLFLVETSNHDMLEIEITVCRSQLVDMRQKIDILTGQKEVLSQDVIDHRMIFDSAFEKLQIIEKRNEEIQNENTTITEILSRAKLEHDDVVKQLEDRVLQKKNIQGKVETLQLHEIQLVKTIHEHSGFISELKSKTEDAKQDMVDMRNGHQKMVQEIDEIQENVKKLKAEYEENCVQNRVLTEQNSTTSETLADMYKQIEDQSLILSKKNDLLDEVSNLTQEVQTIHVELSGAKEKLDSLRDQNTAYEEDQTRLTLDIQRHTSEIQNLQHNLCDLRKQDRDLKLLLSDSESVRQENTKLMDEKTELEASIEILVNQKSKMCSETAEMQREYQILAKDYDTKLDDVTALDDEITGLNQELQECAVKKKKAMCIQDNISDLMNTETKIMAERKNLQIEIQQLIQVVDDCEQQKKKLNLVNTEMDRKISEQSSTIKSLSCSIEEQNSMKLGLEHEVCVLATQLKNLVLSEQKLIHIESKLNELNLEKGVIEIENEKQTSENQRITKEIQDMIGIHEASELKFKQMEKDYPLYEQKMSEMLLLIQEQQLKKQQVEIDVGIAIEQLEHAISEKVGILENCSEIENQHLCLIEQLRKEQTESEYQHMTTIRKHEDSRDLCKMDHERLQSEMIQLQQEISEQMQRKTSIMKQTDDQKVEFNFYKNKLLVVDAYSAGMESVVHKIHKLALDHRPDSYSDTNSIVLAEIISSIVSFLDWFETVFVFKLHTLSTLMLNSQV
jgi:chromosome segregation ATPase